MHCYIVTRRKEKRSWGKYKTNLIDNKLPLVNLNLLNTLLFQYNISLRSMINPINSTKKLKS